MVTYSAHTPPSNSADTEKAWRGSFRADGDPHALNFAGWLEMLQNWSDSRS